MKGVVELEGLFVNIWRETLQQILGAINKNLVKKCLNMLAEECRKEIRLQSSMNSWVSDSNLDVTMMMMTQIRHRCLFRNVAHAN